MPFWRQVFFPVTASLVAAASVLTVFDLAFFGKLIPAVQSKPVAGLSIFAVLILAAYGIASIVFVLRGRHHWNTSELEISITYTSVDGATAVSQRTQKLSPNVAGTLGIYTGVTTSGDIKPEDWQIAESGKQQIKPERSLMKMDSAKKAICFMCPDNKSFPYPVWGLFAPRSKIAKHYSATLMGTINYSNAFTGTTEYLSCDPIGPVDKLVFKLKVPSARVSDDTSLMVWRFRRDNSVLGRKSFPFRQCQPVDSDLPLHEGEATLLNLRPEEVVRFEWTLNI